MHSYLISGGTEQEIDKTIDKIASTLKADSYEFQINKISDVRELAAFTKLKVNGPTCIIIKRVEAASVPAMNAFLKNLEEPQEYINYILTASSTQQVLPIIVSRCQIISLDTIIGMDDITKNNLEKFFLSDTSYKLSFINSIKKKSDATAFTKNLLIFAHQKLLLAESNYLAWIKIINRVKTTYSNLLGNANVGLALTNLVLSIAENKPKIYN